MAFILLVWAASHFGGMFVDYAREGDRWWYVIADRGLGAFEQTPAEWAVGPEFRFVRDARWDFFPPTVLGFSFKRTSPKRFIMTVPLCSVAAIQAGLTWLVWRKTRRKLAGRAFPVEPATNSNADR
jgi:hypothetical protein